MKGRSLTDFPTLRKLETKSLGHLPEKFSSVRISSHAALGILRLS
jgi:hypothetical protein